MTQNLYRFCVPFSRPMSKIDMWKYCSKINNYSSKDTSVYNISTLIYSWYSI